MLFNGERRLRDLAEYLVETPRPSGGLDCLVFMLPVPLLCECVSLCESFPPRLTRAHACARVYGKKTHTDSQTHTGQPPGRSAAGCSGSLDPEIFLPTRGFDGEYPFAGFIDLLAEPDPLALLRFPFEI